MFAARLWIVLAALLGASGVALGAYHAHGLEKALEKRGLETAEVVKQMENCEVAVRYQMFHGLAILGIGILATRAGGRLLLHLAGAAMLLGIAGFSGGLYCMVFAGPKLHWSIVPLGGLAMILGWLLLGLAGLLVRTEPPQPQPAGKK